jgi:ubiquinol-cytochrome c reductase cytochrome c subunit
MTRLLLVAFVLSAALASQAQAPQRPAAAAPAGNADAGKKLYVSVGCYQCHGYEAQGSNATGPRLGPRPMAFPAFSRYVRQPPGQMPPYTAKVVSDADLANIYAFIQSRPEPAKEIPLLKTN